MLDVLLIQIQVHNATLLLPHIVVARLHHFPSFWVDFLLPIIQIRFRALPIPVHDWIILPRQMLLEPEDKLLLNHVLPHVADRVPIEH